MTITAPAPAPDLAAPTGVTLRARPGGWWLHPAWTASLTVLPGLALTCWLTDDQFRSWWGTPKYFEAGDAFVVLVLLGAFVAGSLLPSISTKALGKTGDFEVTAAQAAFIARAAKVLSALTLAGYAAWLAIGLLRGLDVGAVQAVFEGGAYTARGYLAPVAGVTTLTQFAPLAVVCLLLDRWITGRRHRAVCCALTVIVVVRVVLNTERLSLVELVVPVLVLTAALLRPGRARSRTWLWALLPLLAPVGLLLVFGLFEYTRSWLSFYAHNSGLGYGEFVLRRIAGYYATSGNNSVIVLDHLGPSLDLPYYSVRFLWNLPLLSELWDVAEVLGFDPRERGLELLWRYGNPEFNTMGGLPVLVADYGKAGAMVWWLICGLLLGMCHRLLRTGDLRGLVLYPVLYIGLADLARIFYWGEGRAFPAIVGALILCACLHRRRQPVDGGEPR